MRSAASVSLRPDGKGGQDNAASRRLERCPDAVYETRFCRHGRQAIRPRRAKDVHLTKGDRMARADDHEMRLIERARDPRRLLREGPRQSSGATPERRGFVGVPFRNGVKIGVAFSVEKDHVAVGATRRDAMTLKLRRDVLDQ